MPSNDQVETKIGICRLTVYSTVGDRELLLDAYVPKVEATAPAVLVIHGGAWRIGNRKQLAGYTRSLCEMGFCCFAIDYRLAPQHPQHLQDPPRAH